MLPSLSSLVASSNKVAMMPTSNEEIKTCWTFIVSNILADALAPYFTMTSAGMILISFLHNILGSALKGYSSTLFAPPGNLES